MKISNSNRAAVIARLRSAHRAGALALVSLSTLRAVETIENREAARLVNQIVAARHTDDSTTELPTRFQVEHVARMARSPFLTPAERAEILNNRPGSVSVVFKAAPAVLDEPLPANHVAAPVEAFESSFVTLTPEEEEHAKREAAVEVAQIEADMKRELDAVSFESDWQAWNAPTDFAPVVPKIARKESPAPVVQQSEADKLRAAILANAKPRRCFVAV